MDSEEGNSKERDRASSESSSESNKSDEVSSPKSQSRMLEKNGRDERKRRSRSRSSDKSRHRRSHRHSDSDRRHHHHRRRHSNRESKRPSSNRRTSESRARRSRSRERSHKRSSRSSRERHSSHKSSRRRSRSPRRKSRSPYRKSKSFSPPPGYNRAMDAQERLARRLEKARQVMKRKEAISRKEKEEEIRRISGLSPSERALEAAKRASQLVGDSTVNVCHDGMTAQAKAHVEALKAKALAETGIEVPSYYNPLAINPLNYAQQAAKRKKLWAKKDDTEVEDAKTDNNSSVGNTAIWSGVKFGDNKSNEKFAKLMGIKGNQVNASEETSEIIKKQAEVFQKLDMQYQQARITTHTQRGLGLGFSSTMIDPNASAQSQAGSMPNS